jgi:hypothetical protein
MAAPSTSSQKPRLFGGVWIDAGELFAGVGFVKLHFDSGVGSEARSRRGDDDHPPAGTVAGQDGAGDPPKNRALTPVSHDRAA